MPTDGKDDESFNEYVDTCTKIQSLFTDSDCVYMLLAGDFNCTVGCRFYDIYCKLLSDLQLICVDSSKLRGIINVAPPFWVEVIYVIPLYGVSMGLNLNLSSVGGRSL